MSLRHVVIAAVLAILAYAPQAQSGVLQLDGQGAYVTFIGTGVPTGSAPFTVEAWINPTSIPTGGQNGGMITFWGNQNGNQANGFRLRGSGGTRHFFWSNDHDENFGIDILPDTTGTNGWHHLALTYDGSQTRWYWNGSQLGSTRTAGSVNVANANYRIGNRLNAEYFHGFIDEVRIWNKARSAAEIAGDYQQQLSGSESNLVAYFDFEGDLGDRAGGNNNGNAVGNAVVNNGVQAPVTAAGGPVIESFTATPAIGFEGDSVTLAWDVDATAVNGSLLIEILAPGGAVVHTSANDSGNFGLVIGDTGGTAGSMTYTLRASESGGDMVVRQATVDIDADPGIPSAIAQSVSTTTTTPLPITLAATDPNNHPNASLTFAIEDDPESGQLIGTPPNVTYTANAGFTGNDSFTFRASDGKYDSPPSTVSIEVVPAPDPPTNIRLGTTNIGDGVTSGEFITTLSTTDVNADDTHTYMLVGGAGATDNGSFSIVGNQLRAGIDFAGLAGSTFSIRLRTTDSAGLSYEESFVLTVVEISSAVVINEVHFNPPDNTVRQEFIEFYNPAATEADLSGWRITGAVNYTFPENTTIPSGGFLVVAEDPPTLESTLNANAIGPYTGRLNSEGETIRLRDPNNSVIDEVDYKVGFPWPVKSDGTGGSIELLNPTLDNSLGSSWRVSVPQDLLPEATLVELESFGWSWRPGDTEASNPISEWRQQNFVEDGTWSQNVQFPIGFGGVTGLDPNTIVTGMQGQYTCLFLRRKFTITPGEIPHQLLLRSTSEDGCIIWINGVEVERQRMDPGVEPTVAMDADTQSSEGSFDEKTILNPGSFLVEGENTIAVQLYNASKGSSDLGFDLELIRPEIVDPIPTPTPSAPNVASLENAPPNIRKVNHTPEQPTSSDPIVITARVSDPEGVASVELEYQIVAPGNYIPSKEPHPISGNNINISIPRPDNPDYDDPANWTSALMRDDGQGGDVFAGDEVYSAIIPAQAHRTLVRYRITVEDSLGQPERVPYPDDASLNFACFVYNGIPDYNGHSAEVLTALPVYHIITRAEDYAQCLAYNSSHRINQGTQARFFYNWNATVVYDGVVYDNIRYRLRGANGRYHQSGKRSMRFRLNDGSFFQARDQFGRKYPKKWRTLTTGKGFDNRGTLTYALNEAVSLYLFNKIGVPGSDTHWVHWRVIDDADEAPDRWRGDFHGLNFILETYDVRLLEAHGLEKGNLYKLINRTGDWAQQQRYQAAFAPDNGADHDHIEQQLDGNDSEQYITDHVNIEKWNLWHALVEAIRHYDYWPSANKNMVYYFEPVYNTDNEGRGKLWILPWDTDASWGPTWNRGHDVVYNALFAAQGSGSDAGTTPSLWPEYFNTVRELRDLLWQPDQIEPLIEEFASFISDFEPADSDRWKGAPADAGNYNGIGGAGSIALANLVQDMKNFAFVGGQWPGDNSPIGSRAAHLDTLQNFNGEGLRIPERPTISYTGAIGFPTNGLSFLSSAFDDPQGVGTFGAMEWRIAEVTDPTAPAHDPTDRFKLEWEADWESGEITTFTSTINIPTVAVRSGHTYRARVRHKDDTGRWGHWSDPVEFTTTLPDISDYLTGLVVSEVMYHPASPTIAEFNAGHDDDDFFEYVELKNVGNVTLDLTELRFTKGIDFDFLGSAITSLSPGEFVLVVKNQAAFEMRYGAGLPVAGEWESSDKLDNGGERLKLSFGAGDGIRDFVYDDAAPWPSGPDGSGPSLSLIDPESVPNHTLAANWRGSLALNGTPGSDGAATPFGTWLSEQGANDPQAPFASSSLSNLLAYAVGADLSPSPESALPEVTTVEVGNATYPALRYRARQGASDVEYTVEVSDMLAQWNSGAAFTVQVGAPQANGDGTETITVRSLESLDANSDQFLRLLASLVP